MAPVFSLRNEIPFQRHLALRRILEVHPIFVGNGVEAQDQDLAYRAST